MALGTVELCILDRHFQPEALSCGLWSISLAIVIPLHGIFVNTCTMRKIELCLAGKEYACNSGDPVLIAGSRRSPGEGTDYPLQHSQAFLVAQLVKNMPAVRKTWVWPLDRENPLEEAMETHSRMPGASSCTEKSGGLLSMGSQRVKHEWETKHAAHHTVQSLVLPVKEEWFPSDSTDMKKLRNLYQNCHRGISTRGFNYFSQKVI